MKKNSRFNGLSSCLGFNSKVFCETDINMVNFQILPSYQPFLWKKTGIECVIKSCSTWSIMALEFILLPCKHQLFQTSCIKVCLILKLYQSGKLDCVCYCQ